jgi:hypothetical protein
MGDVEARLLELEAGIVSFSGWPQKIRSGLYVSTGGGGATGGITQDRLCLAPLIIPSPVTFIEANVLVQTAVGGTVLRGGIYSDDGNGAPANLIYEFPATFSTAGTGGKTQVINISLSPGLYWVGGAVQGGTGVNMQLVGAYPAGCIVNSLQAQSNTARSYFLDGVSGALPAIFSFDITKATLFCPVVTLKVQ